MQVALSCVASLQNMKREENFHAENVTSHSWFPRRFEISFHVFPISIVEFLQCLRQGVLSNRRALSRQTAPARDGLGPSPAWSIARLKVSIFLQRTVHSHQVAILVTQNGSVIRHHNEIDEVPLG